MRPLVSGSTRFQPAQQQAPRTPDRGIQDVGGGWIEMGSRARTSHPPPEPQVLGGRRHD